MRFGTACFVSAMLFVTASADAMPFTITFTVPQQHEPNLVFGTDATWGFTVDNGGTSPFGQEYALTDITEVSVETATFKAAFTPAEVLNDQTFLTVGGIDAVIDFDLAGTPGNARLADASNTFAYLFNPGFNNMAFVIGSTEIAFAQVMGACDSTPGCRFALFGKVHSVPEPASLVLLAVGGAVLTLARRRHTPHH